MQVTRRARAIFDCLRVLPDEAAFTVLDRSLRQGLISLEELGARMAAFRGQRGAPRLAQIVGAAALGPRSHAERRLVELLRRAGIRGWLANFRVDGLYVEVDVAFPAIRLAIEVDGRAYHVSAEQFERDRDRQNRLVSAGWTVLRFTWRDLTERPDHVVAAISAMITKPRAS